MKPRFLLPHSLKKVGWILFIPAIIFGIAVLHMDFEIAGFDLRVGTTSILVAGEPLNNNLTNELAGLMFLFSGFLVGFSKERMEDERVSKIRLESLQWSVYLNYALLLFALLLVYDEEFLYVMVYNLFTILIFFIVRFHFVLYIKDRLFRKTEQV